MKKNIIWIVGAVVIVAAVAAMLIFVLSGKDDHPVVETDLTGSWKVIANVTSGKCDIPAAEVITFENGSVNDYRDNKSEPFTTSTYTIDGDVLELKDISRTYRINVMSDNVITLYTSDDTFIRIMKLPAEDIDENTIEPSFFEGKWNVAFNSGSIEVSSEYFEFSGLTVKDFRNGESTPTFESDFSITNGHILANSIEKDLAFFIIDADTMILVDTDGGKVWESNKAA